MSVLPRLETIRGIGGTIQLPIIGYCMFDSTDFALAAYKETD